MALADVWSYANAPLAIVVVGAVLRWGWRIDRGLSESVQNAVLLRQQLEAHAVLDETRLNEHSRRLDNLEDRARWA